MAAFPCPCCGETISVPENTTSGNIPCGACWKYVPIPDSVGSSDEPQTPTISLNTEPPQPSSEPAEEHEEAKENQEPLFQSPVVNVLACIGGLIVVAGIGCVAGFGAIWWLGISMRFCGGLLTFYLVYHIWKQEKKSRYEVAMQYALLLGAVSGMGIATRQEKEKKDPVEVFLGARPERKRSPGSWGGGPGRVELKFGKEIEKPEPPEFLEFSSEPTGEEIATAYKSKFYFVGTSLIGSKSGEGIVGSGLMLANDRKHGLIVTNRHVIDPVYFAKGSGVPIPKFKRLAVTVRSPAKESGTKHPATIVAVHLKEDLALLLLNARFDGNRAVRLASLSQISLGGQVYSLGNPLGRGFRMFPGTVTNEPQQYEYIDHSCQLDPGYSGGPLFLQDRGLLAGVNTLVVGRGGNIAIPAEQILVGLHKSYYSTTTSKKTPLGIDTRSRWGGLKHGWSWKITLKEKGLKVELTEEDRTSVLKLVDMVEIERDDAED